MKQLTPYRRDSLWDFMSEVERSFNELWGPVKKNSEAPAGRESFLPPVDVHETPEMFVVSLDIPGVNEKDVKVDVHNGRLTVSGERRTQQSGKSEDGLFRRFEKSYGTFTRSFQLPQNVKEDKIEARQANGVLEILIPKAEEAKPRSIQIGKSTSH